MSTQHTPGPYMAEVEFSKKKWAAEHPALFSAKFLEFVEQHPAPYWAFSMSVTSGFFTIRAAIAKATEAPTRAP